MRRVRRAIEDIQIFFGQVGIEYSVETFEGGEKKVKTTAYLSTKQSILTLSL